MIFFKLFFFFKLLPFANSAIESISKIMAMSFKFGQQIQDGEIILIEKANGWRHSVS